MRKAEVLTLIVDATREVLPELAEHDFLESDSLADLGADSMDRADIIMQVLERMNLEIPLVETVGPENIGELARHLSDRDDNHTIGAG